MTVRLCYKCHPNDEGDILPIVYKAICHKCGSWTKVRYKEISTTHPQKESHH